MEGVFIYRNATQGQCVSIVGDLYRMLATGPETGGHYATMEATVPPGGGPPPHRHSREIEWFHVLEGTITFTVDGVRQVVKAGEFTSVPIGSFHAFKNETDTTARMIISIAPAGIEQMFLEAGVPTAPGDPPKPPTQADIERLLAIAPRYGVEIAPPGH